MQTTSGGSGFCSADGSGSYCSVEAGSVGSECTAGFLGWDYGGGWTSNCSARNGGKCSVVHEGGEVDDPTGDPPRCGSDL
jgi:hypothetical protein